VAFAEGELVTVCTRLFSEILLGRRPSRTIRAHSNMRMVCWKRTLNRRLLTNFGDHRSPKFNSLILPQSQAVIKAIRHAPPYSAAPEKKTPLDMYECTVG
ncbi:hypothetical protein K438DRAFT_1618165, partial [Mycena galopus ATCC 62051]